MRRFNPLFRAAALELDASAVEQHGTDIFEERKRKKKGIPPDAVWGKTRAKMHRREAVTAKKKEKEANN